MLTITKYAFLTSLVLFPLTIIITLIGFVALSNPYQQLLDSDVHDTDWLF